ncbi:MAG: hypothetical protein J6U13_06075 [Salinivirgaceae bacterium]|nr:hypothetical protein [Salinivirgaceae bacterium]
MEASYSIIKKENEYRVSLTSVNQEALPDHIRAVLADENIDVSELMIERVSGKSATGQDVLHDITGWVAELFFANPNLIVYYSCDDMTPIPRRNKRGGNRNMPVNEYRSKLFTRIFDTYMASHQVTGVTNTPIRIDNYENGIGYSLFFHFIARNIHNNVVEILKDNIVEVSGK